MIDELKSKASAEAEKVVAAGKRVRAGVANVTSEAIAQTHRAGGELLSVICAVRDGAVRGAQTVVADDADSRLREVIDGIVDGVSTAANAVSLTIEESAASGKRFASEDLKNAEENFKQVQGSLAEALGGLGLGIKGLLSEQTQSLGEHAASAVRQAGPVFIDTLETLARNAPTVAGEAAKAGSAGVKAGAGTLFEEIGSRLARLGEQLESDQDRSAPGK